ncbi:MAG: hypothetical protein HQ596_01745 [Candidatus Saganbacteria bacterium]|nr:hypothetical protein [Candidatus Saganbacteria bacterium]
MAASILRMQRLITLTKTLGRFVAPYVLESRYPPTKITYHGVVQFRGDTIILPEDSAVVFVPKAQLHRFRQIKMTGMHTCRGYVWRTTNGDILAAHLFRPLPFLIKDALIWMGIDNLSFELLRSHEGASHTGKAESLVFSFDLTALEKEASLITPH